MPKKHFYSRKARLATLIEDVAVSASVAAAISELEGERLLKAELESDAKKYWKAVKAIERRTGLTEEKLAFAEAERVSDLVIYAGDCLNNFDDLPQKHLPAKFVKNLLDLKKQALKFRNKFCQPR